MTDLPKSSKKSTKITDELAFNVLKDKYHNHLSGVQICERHNIGTTRYKQIINDLGPQFIETMGEVPKKQETKVTKESFGAYLKSKTPSS